MSIKNLAKISASDAFIPSAKCAPKIRVESEKMRIGLYPEMSQEADTDKRLCDENLECKMQKFEQIDLQKNRANAERICKYENGGQMPFLYPVGEVSLPGLKLNKSWPYLSKSLMTDQARVKACRSKVRRVVPKNWVHNPVVNKCRQM